MLQIFLSLLLLLLPRLTFGGAYLYDVLNKQKIQRKWTNPKIRWRYDPTNAPPGAKEIIQQAFRTWELQSQSKVSDEYLGTTSGSSPKADGISDISFNTSLTSFGGNSGIIALTLLNSSLTSPTSANDAEIREADILINPTYVSQLITSTPSDPSQLDVVEILTHEIGHAFGLAHAISIDSMMYPSKPTPDSSAALKALFRTPKHDLSQDDIAWLSALYPSSTFKSQTGEISGQVVLNEKGFVGAYVTAVKADEPDLTLGFFSQNAENNLIIKGMQNVAGFSEEDGQFLLQGLKPGKYKVIVQNASGFMGFSLANINDYLSAYGSSGAFPLQFLQTTTCSEYKSLSLSDLSTAETSASEFTIAANQGYCGLKIEANSSRGICGSSGNLQSSCQADGGGCAMHSQKEPSSNFILLLLMAGAILLLRRLRA